MRRITNKEYAFYRLSAQAKLFIELEEATTDTERFMKCVKYATEIAERKSLTDVNEITNTNLKIIMKLIKSYLDTGVDPNYSVNSNPALFLAITYPCR